MLKQSRNRRLICRTVGNRPRLPAPYPPTARHGLQQPLYRHCITSAVWQRKLCAHISSDVAQMEVCTVPFSKSPSLHHGLKEAALKRAFQLLNAAPGEQISSERPKEVKPSLLCIARTAAPVSRGGT